MDRVWNEEMLRILGIEKNLGTSTVDQRMLRWFGHMHTEGIDNQHMDRCVYSVTEINRESVT